MRLLLQYHATVVVGLFLGMFACVEFGRRLGLHHRTSDPRGDESGLGPVAGAVFGLFGLLVAFTFGGAASRFDHRRDLIAEEANAIGTAWLRLDLLSEASQPALRGQFRDYLDARLETYRLAQDEAAALAKNAEAVALQGRIWSAAAGACRDEGSQPCMILLLPALNAMIDITNTRTMSTLQHPPAVVFGMLFALAFACSVLAGYGMAGNKRRSWTHMILFAATTVVTIFVIIDMEYPRLGFIRVEAADQALIDLRKSMD